MHKFKDIFILSWLGLAISLGLLGSAAAGESATRLDIITQPAGATVMINHINRGTTPLVITDLPANTHLVQTVMAGYQDHFESVTLENNTDRILPITLEPTTGLLLLSSDPVGCEVSAGGITLGKTPLLVTTLTAGTHKLSVTTPGYQTQEVEITLEGRTPLKKHLQLLSDSGTLIVNSEPAGAAVLINGINRGTTPCRVERIPGGVVQLGLQIEGCEPHTREITLAAGEVQELTINLQPLPAGLRIVSIPERARVYMNNEFRGLTPLELEGLTAGEHRFRLDLAGHESMVRNLNLVPGTTVTEEFRLSVNCGRIEVVTAPAGATILLDGKKTGVSMARIMDSNAVSEPMAIENIAEGEHIIEVFRQGFVARREKIEIKKGETVALHFTLQRQFIPNYEVITARAHYKGVREFENEEGIRLETAPGISHTIPKKDIRRHGPLISE